MEVVAMIEPTKPWRYSHTQLALWKQCKRRYYERYVLGKKEPTTDNMAAGTWLAQNPIEYFHSAQLEDLSVLTEVFWEGIWANFLAEFGGDDDYDLPLFTLDLAKRILKAYKANPVQGKVVEIERTYELDFGGGIVYTSRPDFVVERELFIEAGTPVIARTTWDIKLKTFNQNKAGDTFFAKGDLSTFDDQCLGQAVLAGADSFGQIRFWLGKKDGTLIGPEYVEHPVDPVLAEEWRQETYIECKEIDLARKLTLITGPLRYWRKNDAACYSFGRPCPRLDDCGFGFQATLLDKPTKED